MCVEPAVQMRAFRYLEKCVPPQPFRDQIMEPNYQQESSLAGLGEDDFFDLPLLEAASPSMRAVVAVVGELSNSRVPVLLIGENFWKCLPSKEAMETEGPRSGLSAAVRAISMPMSGPEAFAKIFIIA